MERKGREKEKQNRQGHAEMHIGICGTHWEKKPEINKI